MEHFRSLDIQIPDGSTLRRDEGNDTVISLKGQNLSESLENDTEFAEFRSKALFPQMAIAFLSVHHELFKLTNPFQELKLESVNTDALGYTHVKFQQVFDAVPVLHSEIIVHLNPSNHIHLVNGRYVPTPSELDLNPSISNDEAIDSVLKKLSDKGAAQVKPPLERFIYAPAAGEPVLAFRVEMHSSNIINDKIYIVDARSGEIIAEFPTVHPVKQK